MRSPLAAAPLRRPRNFPGIDPFAGRADENELLRAHPVFRDRAKALHGIAAGYAHDGRRFWRVKWQAFNCGRGRLFIWHIRGSTESGGSATGLSATNAWRSAVVGDESHVRLITSDASQVLHRRRTSAAAPAHCVHAVIGSPGRIRTSDQPVNSRLLYR